MLTYRVVALQKSTLLLCSSVGIVLHKHCQRQTSLSKHSTLIHHSTMEQYIAVLNKYNVINGYIHIHIYYYINITVWMLMFIIYTNMFFSLLVFAELRFCFKEY